MATVEERVKKVVVDQLGVGGSPLRFADRGFEGRFSRFDGTDRGAGGRVQRSFHEGRDSRRGRAEHRDSARYR